MYVYYANDKDRILKNIKEVWHERLQSYCWIWQLAVNSHGYGTITVRKHTMQAHRFAYKTFKGEIPEGLYACHHCDAPTCCNPDHIYPGTQQQNMNDMVQRNRRGITFQNGECNPNGKLSATQVLEIPIKYATGNYTQLQLANEYGVGETQIHRIIHGQSWKHLKQA